MLWPWITRKRADAERRDLLKLEQEYSRETMRRLVRDVESAHADYIAETLQPFVDKWTHAEAKNVGGSIAITLHVHPETLDEIRGDETINRQLGDTLGRRFAAELRNIVVLVREAGPRSPRMELW